MKDKKKKKYFPSQSDGDISKEEWEKWNIEYFGEMNYYQEEEDDSDETEELNFDRDN